MHATNGTPTTPAEIPKEVQALIVGLWLLLSDIDETGGGEELEKEARTLRCQIDECGYWIEVHKGLEPGDIFLERKFIGKPTLH